jgi:hypothetical protein
VPPSADLERRHGDLLADVRKALEMTGDLLDLVEERQFNSVAPAASRLYRQLADALRCAEEVPSATV